MPISNILLENRKKDRETKYDIISMLYKKGNNITEACKNVNINIHQYYYICNTLNKKRVNSKSNDLVNGDQKKIKQKGSKKNDNKLLLKKQKGGNGQENNKNNCNKLTLKNKKEENAIYDTDLLNMCDDINLICDNYKPHNN
jgi:hypothetical protein